MLLDTVPSCPFVQYQGKLKLQTWENDKKLISGPIVDFTSTAVLDKIFADFFTFEHNLSSPQVPRVASQFAKGLKT